MINKVILIGNLGKDPDVRRLENGTAVGRMTVATNENYKDKDGVWQKQTEWHNVVVWRELAERAETSFKKGMLVFIEGKLTTRKYADKDGQERYATEVVANTCKLLEKAEHATNGTPPQAEHQQAPPIQEAQPAEVDDLPF